MLLNRSLHPDPNLRGYHPSQYDPLEFVEPVRRQFYLGCDLGQAADPTALSVVEHVRGPGETVIEKACRRYRLSETSVQIRHLERLPLRMSYPEVVAEVGRLMATSPLAGRCALIVDRTGVGRPVVDMFADAGLRPIGITITAGDNWSLDPNDPDSYRVSKLALVSRLQALLHQGQLLIAKSLAEADTLARELQDFRVRFTASGNATFGAREGRHDDLVLSVAIAAWYAWECSQPSVGSREI